MRTDTAGSDPGSDHSGKGDAQLPGTQAREQPYRSPENLSSWAQVLTQHSGVNSNFGFSNSLTFFRSTPVTTDLILSIFPCCGI